MGLETNATQFTFWEILTKMRAKIWRYGYVMAIQRRISWIWQAGYWNGPGVFGLVHVGVGDLFVNGSGKLVRMYL